MSTTAQFDIFSLGSIFFEMLSRKDWFKHKGWDFPPVALFMNGTTLSNKCILDFDTHKTVTDNTLKKLFQSATCFNPAGRFTDLSQFLAQLQSQSLVEKQKTPAKTFIEPEMVLIKGGTFLMGSPSDEPERQNDETQHQVTLSDFYMGKHAVTFEEYDKYCTATGKEKPSDEGWGREKRPVINVSWEDAAYCAWLSKQTGKRYCLPTEAEWEYACRAGTTTPFNTGNNLTTSQANYNGNFPYNGNAKGEYRKKTSPVGSFAPNAWGLYDMHGNVWECCNDWYGDYPTTHQTNPQGATIDSTRVVRGGSWYDGAEDCRTVIRGGSTPDYRFYVFGFRLVCDVVTEKDVAPIKTPTKNYTETATGVPFDMIFIKGGTFLMGSPESEPERRYDETQHQVTVSDFYMGKHTVTFDEYDKYCTATGKEKPSDVGWGRGKHPVLNVSWDDATAYCEWLSKQNGKSYRLPTEAEWEYACRAGTTTPFKTGNNLTTSQANYDGNYPYNGKAKGEYREKTTPVGSFARNAWGLYDMHGNIWEWCNDWHGDYPTTHQTNPQGATIGSYRVLRGGSWDDGAEFCRTVNRNNDTPEGRFNVIGFRLVRNN